MKKTVLALAMTLTAAAALAQSGAKPSTMPAKNALHEALMANEHKLLDAVRAKDAKAFSALVKGGSWSIDENGFMPVDDLIKAMGDPKSDLKIEMIKVADMKVIDVDANAAIVAYTTEQKGSFMGMAFPPKTFVTTTWANHGGAWHAVFHQESTAAAPRK